MNASPRRIRLVRSAALAAAVLAVALPALAGWVGVGGAMRENSRSIAFGRSATLDYMYLGMKHYGVFLSTDQGLTWQPTSLDEFLLWGGPEAGSAEVNAVVTNGGGYSGPTPLVLAGTSSGQVWFSTSHGASWCIAVGLPGSAIMDLAIQGGTVYAATYGHGVFTAPESQFASCSPAPAFVRLTMDPCGTDRVMKVAFGPGGDLYACTDGDGTTSGGVYAFIDNAWLDRCSGLPSGVHGYASLAFGLDGQTVPGVGDELWVGSISGSGLWYSSYRGSSWESVPCYPCGNVLDIRAARDYKPTGDSSPNQHIYWGTEWGWYEGFFSMGDSSFVCDFRYPAGLSANSVVPDLDWSPTNPVVWLATSDGIRRVAPGAFPAPPDDPLTGQDLSRFDISFLVPSPAYGNSTSDGLVFAASEQFGVFRSLDNGATYHKYMPPLDEATGGAEVSHPITGLAIHPLFNAGSSCGSGTSSVFMAAYGVGIFRSDAGGSLWVPMSEGLPGQPPSGTLPVTHVVHTPLVPPDGYDILFASMEGGSPSLYRYNSHTNPGPFWSPVSSFPADLGNITCIALPPRHDGTMNRQEVWVGTESGLLKSTNRGDTWTAFATLPPNSFGPVMAIAFHPAYDYPLGANKYLFVARKGSGVFRSMDGGNTWQAVNAGLSACSGAPTFSWAFGDGQTSTAQTPSHNYSNPGTYIWTLDVVFGGQTIRRSGTVKVLDSAGCGLQKGDASATPSVGLLPLTVDFEAAAAASGCPTGNLSYSWSFGDGSPAATGRRVAHTYRSSGSFDWTLTTTVDSETFTSTGQIKVLPSGACTWTCRATANPPTVLAGAPVSFQGAAQPYLYVSSLAISPSYATDQMLLVGLNDPMQRNAGGVYLCLNGNGAATWNAKVENLPDLHVKALAFAKTASGVGARLLCGTQRMKAFYTDSPALQGAPWVTAGGYATATGEIRALVVSPVPTNFGCAPGSQSGTDVFAGGDRGVFWSNDGGETFRPINEGLMLSGTTSACVPMTVNCLQLFVNPDHETEAGTGYPTPMLLAGTVGNGIWYRYATRTPVGTWDWTQGIWQQSNVGSTHTILRFARERTVFPLRAAGSSGIWTSPGKDLSGGAYGEIWAPSGLADATDIRHGQAPPEKEGFPEAPSGNTSWGTVMGTGVQKGTGTTFRPEAITWEVRNGEPGGVGYLADKSVVQSVIQLASGTVLTGTRESGGGVWRTEDEGTVYWEASGAGLESVSTDVADFLEVQADTRTPPNYDAFVALNGSGTTEGGVYLSGDDGRHWVSLSEGFDASEQTLSSIVASEGDPPTYYAGTYTHGSYAATLTALPYPTVTNLSTTTSSSTGGGSITVTGTGFLGSCPSGYGCIDTSAVVAFGGVDAPTTFVSSTQLTATVPAHPGGAVTVSVRNPDTRAGRYSGTFTYAEAEGGSPEFKLTVSRNGSNQVVASWENAPTSGTRILFRSPEPDFSVQLHTQTSGGTSGSVTYADATGTNGYLYFYKVE